mmetsp:Transcript_33918/g.72422  ORF Transcript_33918/g.72422 Transcript_33918/m.72422 type:complete len:304 (-) Transcript_33918:276-1187(-)
MSLSSATGAPKVATVLPRARSIRSATHAEAVASRPAPRPCEKTGPTKSPRVKRPLSTPCVAPSAASFGTSAGCTRWSTTGGGRTAPMDRCLASSAPPARWPTGSVSPSSLTSRTHGRKGCVAKVSVASNGSTLDAMPRSLMEKPSSSARATSSPAMLRMPSTCTPPYEGRAPEATAATSASLCAVSTPSTSRSGGVSAYPSACASASTSSKPRPVSFIVLRMKLHVPLRIPAIYETRLAAQPSRSVRMHGMPPPTAASQPMLAPFASAAVASSRPWSASSALFAVMSETPRPRAPLATLRATP